MQGNHDVIIRTPLVSLLARALLSASVEPRQTLKMQLESGGELTRITSHLYYKLRAKKKPVLHRFPLLPIHLSQESLQN